MEWNCGRTKNAGAQLLHDVVKFGADRRMLHLNSGATAPKWPAYLGYRSDAIVCRACDDAALYSKVQLAHTVLLFVCREDLKNRPAGCRITMSFVGTI